VQPNKVRYTIQILSAPGARQGFLVSCKFNSPESVGPFLWPTVVRAARFLAHFINLRPTPAQFAFSLPCGFGRRLGDRLGDVDSVVFSCGNRAVLNGGYSGGNGRADCRANRAGYEAGLEHGYEFVKQTGLKHGNSRGNGVGKVRPLGDGDMAWGWSPSEVNLFQGRRLQ